MRRPASVKRALGVVLAATLGALIVPFSSPTAPAAAATGLHRAININGNTLVVDGVTFESEFTASGVSVAGSTRGDLPASVPLSPPATGTLSELLRGFVWGVDETNGVHVDVTVPNNQAYTVTLWTVEDTEPNQIGFLVNGAPFADVTTGAPGSWQKVGPLPVIVTDGHIHISSRFGAANISAVRIDHAEFPDGYIALPAPRRVLDTRPASPTFDNAFAGQGIRPAGSILELEVGGRAGVLNGAASVALNLADTNPDRPGFVTVYPCGGGLPNVSTINFGPGQTVSNTTIVGLGTNGRLCLYTIATTDLIVDVSGYFVTSNGFKPLASPQRILETRPGQQTTTDGAFYGGGQNPGQTPLALTVVGRAGVPAGTKAVALNITGTGSAVPGYVTVYPCDAALPTAANLNYFAGQTVGNAVVAGLSAAGQVCLFTSSATDLIVDISGYFVGAANKFTPLPAPQRVLETRPGLPTADGQFFGIGMPGDGNVAALPVAGRVGIPLDAQTVTLNVAVTESTLPGFITVFPCGSPIPTAANLNYVANDTVSNSVIAKIGTNGTVCIYNSAATHIVVDVSGTLTT